MIKHNLYNEFALNIVFQTWPQDRIYDEIIALCMNDDLRRRHNEECISFKEYDKSLLLNAQYENECFSNIPELLNDLADRALYHFGEYIIEEVDYTREIVKILKKLNSSELTAIRHVTYKLQDQLDQIEKDKLEYK